MRMVRARASCDGKQHDVTPTFDFQTGQSRPERDRRMLPSLVPLARRALDLELLRGSMQRTL